MSSMGGRGRSSGTYRGGGGRGRSYRGGRGRGRGRGRGLGGGPYGGRGDHSAGENGDSTPQAGFDPNVPKSGGDNGGSHEELVDLLRRLDGKSYPAYHDIESSTRGWANDGDGYTLYVARAQSDPFARPTRCRVIVKGDTAKFPTVSYQNRIRTVALSDFLNRMFYDCCRTMGADVGYAKGGGWSGPKGGDIDVSGECDLILRTGMRWDGMHCNSPWQGGSAQLRRVFSFEKQTHQTKSQRNLCCRSRSRHSTLSNSRPSGSCRTVTSAHSSLSTCLPGGGRSRASRPRRSLTGHCRSSCGRRWFIPHSMRRL